VLFLEFWRKNITNTAEKAIQKQKKTLQKQRKNSRKLCKLAAAIFTPISYS
jgi:hypothetical protein